jgi:hypothetical protein
MDFASWFLIVVGAASAVILGSVLWTARRDAAGKPDGSDTAIGLGILNAQQHTHHPVDSGGAGTGSVSGDAGGGSAAP